MGWGIQVSGQRIKGWVTSSPSLPVPQAFADCLSAPEGSSSQTYSPSDVAGGLLLQASRGNGGAAAGLKWLRGPSPGCGLQPRAGAAPCWPERGHTRGRSRPGREGTLSRLVQFGQEKTDEEAPELVCGEAGARSQVRAPVKPDAHSRDSDAWRETEVQGGLRPPLPPASLIRPRPPESPLHFQQQPPSLGLLQPCPVRRPQNPVKAACGGGAELLAGRSFGDRPRNHVCPAEPAAAPALRPLVS